MNAWNVIINSFIEELYVGSDIQFKKVCVAYMDFLK